MRLVEKRGATGYMVFFATLEIYAREFKIRDGWKLVISLQSYCRLLALRRADLVQSSLQFIADSGKWEIEINDGMLTVYIPKFLELLDESTQKKLRAKEKENPETFRNKEADRDREEDIKKECKNTPMRVPQKEIIALYHEILPELPPVEVWNQYRQTLLRTRWKEDEKRQNLDWWKWYFNHVRQCPHLMGKRNDFRASLEWLIRPKNMPKVLEGNYLDRKGPLSMFSEKGQRTAENLARALAAGGGDE